MLNRKLNTKFTSTAIIILIIALTLSIFTFAGCKKSTSNSVSGTGKNDSTTSTKVAEDSVETKQTVSSEDIDKTQNQGPIEATDGMGNKITLDKPAQKVIVYSPALLEIFSGLDAMDKVAEVDSWSVQNKDPLAKGFKGAGDVNGINFEVLTKINPDLVIVVGSSYASNSSNDFGKLTQLGFTVYMSNSTSLEGTYSEIENIGKLTFQSNHLLKS